MDDCGENNSPCPEEPNTTMPDDATDVEAETGFLEDRDPENCPSVPWITSDSEQPYREAAFDRLERLETGEEVSQVINFQNPGDLRPLLTGRRVEPLRSIMAERPDSIPHLTERLDCDVKTVHDDLQVLTESDIAQFKQVSRTKRAFVACDSIEISLGISTPYPADDTTPA